MAEDCTEFSNDLAIRSSLKKNDNQIDKIIDKIVYKNNIQTILNLTSPQTSQQILSRIYLLLESQNPIQHKDISISADKKINNTNFKCKCKKTKCLKMYCQCFSLGRLCNGCQCSQCQNILQFENIRATAIDQALSRDPDIFQSVLTVRKGGCICKKTACLKKYCQCFSTGIPCGLECKCQNCSNSQ